MMMTWIIRRFRVLVLCLLALGGMIIVPTYAVAITVDLVAEKVSATMPDNTVVPMWGFRESADATNPGAWRIPTISAVAGDSLTINLANNLNGAPGLVEPVSILVPGQKATESGAMTPQFFVDGQGRQRVRAFTHEAAAGNTDSYQWANLKAGTYLIQSATHTAVQMQMGLYAILKVDAVAGSRAYGDDSTTIYDYRTDVTLLFSEIDPILHEAVATGVYGTGNPVPSTGLPMTSTMDYNPTYFLVNGQPYSAGTEAIFAGAPGFDILLRLLNAGLKSRMPLLQGSYMTVLAEDGNPLPFTHEQYSIDLAPGKTMDAMIKDPQEGLLPLYDRRLALSNAGAASGGMLTFLHIGGVVVTAPIGGEIFNAGTTETVTWTAPPHAATFYLRYSTDGGPWTLLDTVVGATSYDWAVPNVTSTNSRFRVNARDASGAWVSQDDSGIFTIQGIQVVSPNSGENWNAGDQVTLQWNAPTNAVNYFVRLSTDGGDTWTLIDTVSNATQLPWTVPNVDSGNCLIRVSARDVGNAWVGNDESDAFFTINPLPLAVTSPSGGDTLAAGRTQTVTWTAPPNAVNFFLRYSTDDGNTWTLIDTVVGVNSYNWAVPNVTSTSTMFRVNARDASNAWIGQDDSGNFTITPLPLAVVSPDVGETLNAGTTHTVSWTAPPNAATFFLRYSTDDGNTWTLIDTITTNTDEYNWTVPDTGSAISRFRVTARDASNVWLGMDESGGTFTIQSIFP